jgi:acyl transferase domain-containing protein
LLTLSGQSPQAVRELAQKYANWLQTHPNISFADTAYTTHLGRKHFKIRATYGAANSLEMIAALTDPDVVPREIDASQPLAFLCTGQGCQFAGMGKTLYETEPVFREIITRCDQAFRGHRGQSLVDVIFAEPIVTDPNREVNNDLIHQTEFTQPGLYAIECGLAALFLSWGVQPDLVLGHSIGEFVAAWVAGVFELETGLLLVAERGRLMQELSSTGGMVSVFATPAMVNRYLEHRYRSEAHGIQEIKGSSKQESDITQRS